MSDLKTVLDFIIEYGSHNDLPNMDGSGGEAYDAALRLAAHGAFDAEERTKYLVDAANGAGYYEDMLMYAPDVHGVITADDLQNITSELTAAFIVGKTMGKK